MCKMRAKRSQDGGRRLPDDHLPSQLPGASTRTGVGRALIRAKLRERMANDSLNVHDAAREIEESRSDIAPDADSRRPLLSHDTIQHFLDEEDKHAPPRSRVKPANVEIIRRYLVTTGKMHDPDLTFNRPVTDFLFLALREFFGVNDSRLNGCKAEMPGAYQLYMESEDYPGEIVIGALRFDIEPITGAVAVTERQEKQDTRGRRLPAAAVENWRGYAFPRSERLIVILQSQVNRVPKFYVFHTGHLNDAHMIGDMQGQMMKLGRSGVFCSRAFILRDDKAFSKCNVVERDSVPQGVLKQLSDFDEAPKGG
jgi:hypothetical protein